MKHAPVLLAVICTLVSAGHTASAQTPPANLLACARVSDPGERLRCYDTQMAAMGVAVGTAPSTVAPVAAAPPAAKFGADDLKLAARPKEAKSDRVLESVITSIHEARPKLFIIVLANGQIWMQEGTQITSFFKVGYDAHIERGLFGDYRMSTHQTGDKNMVKVTRIQ
ncbi:MAG TPA: hypothetical protein VIY90_20025 [Steroidobacteraceae bacterium]